MKGLEKSRAASLHQNVKLTRRWSLGQMQMSAEQEACWMMMVVMKVVVVVVCACVCMCLCTHMHVCVQLELIKDDERETKEGEDDS